MKKKMRMSLLIAAAAGLVTLMLWVTGMFDGMENKSLDLRFGLRGAVAPSPDIAIVAVDEESIAQLGRWPWPRRIQGDLIRSLTRAGARSIVFDILFTEPDSDHPGSDEQFAKTVRQSGKTVLGALFQKMNSNGQPQDLLLPLPLLLRNARVGFVNFYPEMDGLSRNAPLYYEYQGDVVPSLALAGLAQYLGMPSGDIVKERRISTNEYHEMAINYCGGYQTFPYYPIHAVLAGRVPDTAFKDKIVLVGGIATALFDFKAIPYSQTFPGVEIHANVMSNILQGNFLRKAPPLVTFLLIVVFALAVGWALGLLSPLKAGIVAVSLFAAYSAGVFALFKGNNTVVEFIAPVFSLGTSYVGVMFYRFMTEEKEKRWIKSTFSHYLSAHVLESILSDPGRLRLGGQRENLTVMFSDIRGFTTISEDLKPEEVVELLNEYLSKMVEIVFKHDGTLDKFIGDAVMAFWGAPVAQNDHPKKAVLCAIEMIDELRKLQEKWKAEGKKIIDIGIGISTGDMVVGNMGSKDKMEYTVIGDNVNLGSRLEGLNKEYKTHIIISDATYQAVKDVIDARPLGTVKVKGKEKTVEIYEVRGLKTA